MKELAETDFHATFAEPMKLAGSRWADSALGADVERIVRERRGIPAPRAPELEKAYVAGDERHAHLLYWYGVPNVYFVVVLSLPSEAVVGFHRIDLNDKYGLPSVPDPCWLG